MQPTAATSIAPTSRVTPTLGNMSGQAALKQQATPDRLRQGSATDHYITLHRARIYLDIQ